MAYAGHQFGQFVPQLGDGRAILLGEVIDRQGHRRDIQLKGSGRTPFSRGGDGKAPLGPVLREYLVSEAMHALGIPTTRSLAAVATGEIVVRQTVQPGGVVTRVAASHVRVGTFQFFAARQDHVAVKRLADYVIDRHYPEIASAERPYLGPCAFMDAYDPAAVFSSIDDFGRYAYANQPTIAQWNLARFAECLVPLLDPDEERAIELANAAITGFWERFQAAYVAGMRAKLGLSTVEEGDLDLARGLLDAMQAGSADFTLTFRRLADAAAAESAMTGCRALFAEPGAFDAWLEGWRARLARDPLDPTERARRMRAVSPALIPRNHLVEAALAAAVERGDMGPFERLHGALAQPFEERPEDADLRAAPPPADEPYRTFCGT
jgi:uncharacterized protein YdiU (UPF0061 family)